MTGLLIFCFIFLYGKQKTLEQLQIAASKEMLDYMHSTPEEDMSDELFPSYIEFIDINTSQSAHSESIKTSMY